MFSKNRNNGQISQANAHSLISKMTEVVGDIHFCGELIIEGKVSGNIYAEDDSGGSIRVAENGYVEGEICVPTVVINGIVKGDVRSAKHIELAAKAQVTGNVYYSLIEMVMGSEVNGNLLHISSEQIEAKLLGLDNRKLAFEKPRVEKG